MTQLMKAAKISMKKRLSLVAGLGAAVLGLSLAGTGHAELDKPGAEPVIVGGPTALRRLNETQYARAVRDVFGPEIKVPGRFDPVLRSDGLMAIGDGKVAVSASGIEQYELRSREIAAQVLAPDKRAAVVGCTPKAASAFDAACAGQFVAKYGRALYRRPLNPIETRSILGVARAATEQDHDFYKGLQAGLSRMLGSPNFIFRIERGAGQRLDDWSLATRISFLLWDAPPDAALLDAAAAGKLATPAGVDAQVDRLIASPRFVDGVRAFFSDMFAYDQFTGLTKDQAIYPKYTSQLAKDAEEQLLRTIVDHLVTGQGDYRDLFTTRKSFLNRNLASVYRVPVDMDGLQTWQPYTFAPEEGRAGILSLVGFLMLDPTHEGRGSPTIRGKTVRELFLCQPVPAPPANVNFSIVQNTGDQVHKTARERLAIHQENPVCAGCHKITDPIGLSMEQYDATGAFRTHENGALIDVSGSFEGKKYDGLMSFAAILRGSPAVPSCVVQRTFEYGVGRAAADGDGPWLDYATARFGQGGYRFPQLMRGLATSAAFRTLSAPGKLAAR